MTEVCGARRFDLASATPLSDPEQEPRFFIIARK